MTPTANLSPLDNKVIVLSGATSGIGKALALELATQGARLALCGRSPSKLEELSREIRPLSARKHYLKAFDLCEEQAILTFLQETFSTLGCPDILINNAGLNAAKASVADIKTTDLDLMLSVNFRAPVIFMREAFNQMKKAARGKIVNILSTTCLFSNELTAGYSASKAALDAYTKIFRKEAHPHNIQVTSIYPGGSDTPFRSNARPDYMSAQSVAKSICAVLSLPADVVPHDFVFRPQVETNF